ncbi:hypothetical protein GWK08_00215 [Leptobacterium flavescens]|uniref:Guanylate cyclase domain-containing protein n=1 Tax=Leptobacterium flavescens TaxID=472055 RepID=A0A6P0ULC1_9FLAO|nr:adenylate/guanylate cyclase domain-containing protein [Leptobacterium flavescens]NER11853.1 hypothetical protein [Leptobacterium flavescens]
MSQNRQLSAIMFTDIEGYTALMQHDEKNAISLRNKHREIFENTTEKYNGKIIQYFGDGTLSVFKSSVEAVNCAIEMQRAFLQEPEIPVRIGMHVGDIVYSEDDIIGDAVNIASRIESCAVSGSILISDKVHDQIRSHRDIISKFLDVYELKNVGEAMPIFAIANEGLVVPDPKDIKGKLQEKSSPEEGLGKRKKMVAVIGVILFFIGLAVVYSLYFSKEKDKTLDYSIAVLPFDNMSTDKDFSIFTDGITEDILTNLSKLKNLHVISRTSVMQYKGTTKTIPEIAKELGVAYILEGSIRKYGDEIRVTAQLIEAESDEHIWAENYDKTLTDIFAIQTEVSKEIVQALHINISSDEQESLASIPTNNLEAYQFFLRGRREADKRNKESIKKSIEFYQKAIDIDPKYAEAYAEIANSIYLETYYAGRDPNEASRLANQYLDKAEAINNKISRIYSVRGLIYNIEGKHDLANLAFEKAIKLSPNDLTARHQYATFFYYTKQSEKQLEQAEIAYRLDPLSFATANSYFTALIANFKYDEAEKLMKTIEENSSDNNKFVINRSYFRLYMDQKDYKSAIEPLKKMVGEQSAYNRFLAYCYGTIGDTEKVYALIDSIKSNSEAEERNHQLAVAFAGIKETDSVLYYLDTIRNNQSRRLRRERNDFFDFLKGDPRFEQLLKAHGIE